ncbi:MAG TPA: hypothetical protein VJA25_15105 [Dehalococcoidia bacterium]|nr:hypothetical protein [Dehalococcoidia bacterium]
MSSESVQTAMPVDASPIHLNPQAGKFESIKQTTPVCFHDPQTELGQLLLGLVRVRYRWPLKPELPRTAAAEAFDQETLARGIFLPVHHPDRIEAMVGAVAGKILAARLGSRLFLGLIAGLFRQLHGSGRFWIDNTVAVEVDIGPGDEETQWKGTGYPETTRVEHPPRHGVCGDVRGLETLFSEIEE